MNKIKSLVVAAVLACPAVMTAAKDMEYEVLVTFHASSATNELCQRAMHLERLECAMILMNTTLLAGAERNMLRNIRECAGGRVSKVESCRKVLVEESLKNFRAME